MRDTCVTSVQVDASLSGSDVRKSFKGLQLAPHPNPGLMSAEWLNRLSRVSPSMGLMLESTSTGYLQERRP